MRLKAQSYFQVCLLLLFFFQEAFFRKMKKAGLASGNVVL